MNNKIKIILVDDELLFRKGISFLLEREKNMEIIFEASNGDELISFLHSNNNHPDIIMMDLKMPVINGVEATKIIRKDFPEIKIIALTSYDSKSFVANMIDVFSVISHQFFYISISAFFVSNRVYVNTNILCASLD